MPFTDEVWRTLPPQERRRLATVWYRRAQPIPRQRGSIGRPTYLGARIVRRDTAWALGTWTALQRGAGDLTACTHQLEQARQDVSAARLRADIGADLARECHDEALAAPSSRIAELSALLLADPEWSNATTTSIDMRPGRTA